MENFICHSCKQEKPVHKSGPTGYGTNSDGEKICYQCAAELDKEALRSLKPGEKIAMYFDKGKREVTNWPETLRIPCYYEHIKHNFAREAYAVSFWFEGFRFYGRNIGDNDIVNVKKAKA